MKILYIITKSEYGGAQTHITQLAKYMTGKRDEVAVMSCPGGWMEETLTNNQQPTINNIRFYPNRYFKNSYNPFLGIKAMREIKKAVADFKPDLVSCHSTFAGFWARLALKNKIPTIFTAHGWGFTEGTSFLRKNLVILAERLAAKYCSKIICVSENDKNLALKYKIAKPGKLFVIHNGVEIINLNQFASLDAKLSSGANQCKSALIKIVFVGRLAQPKDPLLLLKSFNSLSSELKDKSRISIVGEGSKRKNLEEFIKENKLEEKVKLLGSMPRTKVFEILKKSDVFVLISKWEGFPRTILEAMSCGLPVIASDVGGVREAITKEVGLLIKRGDKDGLKKALVKLIDNLELREKMGRASREKVERDFSLEKMLSKTEKTYISLLR